MNNVGFNVRTDNRDEAKEALKLAFKVCCEYGHPYRKNSTSLYYTIIERVGLVFSWSDHNGQFKPFEQLSGEISDQLELFTELDDILEAALQWVDSQEARHYTPRKEDFEYKFQYKDESHSHWDNYIDMDGSCKPEAYRIYTGKWGHIKNHWWCCAIKPVYAWYGK